MTKEQLDSARFDGTITTGTNETLEVDTRRAEDILILIDDGTTDSQPATYDMTQRVYTSSFDAYQLYDEVTGETSRSWVDDAWGEKMEFEFNNQSGSDASYRIVVRSYRDVS